MKRVLLGATLFVAVGACFAALSARAQEDSGARWREVLARWQGANEEQRGFILSDLKFAGEEAAQGLSAVFEAGDAAARETAETRGGVLAAECRERILALRSRIRALLERMPARAAVDATAPRTREMAEALDEIDVLVARPAEWVLEHATTLGSATRGLAAAAELLDALSGGTAWAERRAALCARLGEALPRAAVQEHRDVTRFAADDRRAAVDNARLGAELSEDERAVLERTNAYRQAMGVRALTLDTRLVAAARAHSAEMTRLDYFSHRSPTRGRADVGDRIGAEGVRTVLAGENIARGAFTPAEIVDGWRDSPGHHRNLIDARFRFTGVGRDGRYWTAVYTGEMR